MDKNKKNAQLNNDLVVGDHVRVSIANYFTKGTEPRYSDEIYTVERVKGMSVNLSDDKTYKRDKLLKIPKDTIKITDTTKPNVIKQATKQHKQHLILKADDIKEENIIEGKRTKNTTKN